MVMMYERKRGKWGQLIRMRVFSNTVEGYLDVELSCVSVSAGVCMCVRVGARDICSYM